MPVLLQVGPPAIPEKNTDSFPGQQCWTMPGWWGFSWQICQSVLLRKFYIHWNQIDEILSKRRIRIDIFCYCFRIDLLHWWKIRDYISITPAPADISGKAVHRHLHSFIQCFSTCGEMIKIGKDNRIAAFLFEKAGWINSPYIMIPSSFFTGRVIWALLAFWWSFQFLCQSSPWKGIVTLPGLVGCL